jgi:hypothetical protein
MDKMNDKVFIRFARKQIISMRSVIHIRSRWDALLCHTEAPWQHHLPRRLVIDALA